MMRLFMTRLRAMVYLFLVTEMVREVTEQQKPKPSCYYVRSVRGVDQRMMDRTA